MGGCGKLKYCIVVKFHSSVINVKQKTFGAFSKSLGKLVKLMEKDLTSCHNLALIKHTTDRTPLD